MSKLFDMFQTSANNLSLSGVPVINQPSSALPETEPEDTALPVMGPSFGTSPAVDAIKFAEDSYADDTYLADSREDVVASDLADGSVEHEMTFSQTDFKLPVYFESFDDLATVVVGNIMLTSALKSINSSHFGKLLLNTAPKGFSRTVFGSHEFFVRDKSDRLVYVFEFLQLAKESLRDHHQYECPLVNGVDINGVTAYTLVLTPKEFLDVQRSYPAYRLSYVDDPDISKLKLIIRVERGES